MYLYALCRTTCQIQGGAQPAYNTRNSLWRGYRLSPQKASEIFRSGTLLSPDELLNIRIIETLDTLSQRPYGDSLMPLQSLESSYSGNSLNPKRYPSSFLPNPLRDFDFHPHFLLFCGCFSRYCLSPLPVNPRHLQRMLFLSQRFPSFSFSSMKPSTLRAVL